MKLYLDTSDKTCILRLDDREYAWEAGNEMAEGIFSFIRDKLTEHGGDWQDISEITFFAGPGSFTGLRIGAAIVNTLADQLQIPLYDQYGKQHKIIIPEYGRPANIIPPKK